MTMFGDGLEHEMFLRMYQRVARKYGWQTLAWALMKNHFHFVLRLNVGGLSEGMRELNGGFSRWRNELHEQTRKGHLVRHAFFANHLQTTEAVVATCVYVDLNPAKHRGSCAPRSGDWTGYAATLGKIHPRPFHSPPALLELLDDRPSRARTAYQRRVREEHDRRRQVLSPNEVPGT
jgi:REP element-mobilizing transposase RayT